MAPKRAGEGAGPANMKLGVVWTIVVGATALSLFTSEFHGFAARSAVLVILGLAYFKARLILVHFVEVGRGSWKWRVFLELWLVAAIGVIALYSLVDMLVI